jgi:nucleotide-binding universal stress UspA family protein
MLHRHARRARRPLAQLEHVTRHDGCSFHNQGVLAMTTANYSNDGNDRKTPYVILAALSTDETGDFALLEASHIAAAQRECELHVVHVVVEDGSTDRSDEIVTLEHRLSRAPSEIEQAIQRMQAMLPSRVIAHLRAGDPARSILQTAVDVDADLLVVGSHQRTRLEKMIVGSVAERVLRGAHCPVLVAVPKNYAGASKSQTIDPPCADCIAARQASAGARYWCERHQRTYSQPHVYEPSDRPASVMPSH